VAGKVTSVPGIFPLDSKVLFFLKGIPRILQDVKPGRIGMLSSVLKPPVKICKQEITIRATENILE